MTDPAKSESLSLGREFPQATRDDWLTLVDGVLKGASFADRLVSTSPDGIDIEPLYTREATAMDPTPALAGLLSAPPGEGDPPWQILPSIGHPDPAEANRMILDALTNGASGISLDLADGGNTSGIAVWTLDNLDRVLDDVHLDMIPVHVRAGARAPEAAALMIELWDKREVSPEQRQGSLGLDPLAVLARSGTIGGGIDAWKGVLGDAARFCAETSGGLVAITADGRAAHEAGGTAVQELAAALAGAVAYLRLMEGEGLGLEVAASQIRFALSADTDLFATIAKLRAMRMIWAQACEACGLGAPGAVIDVETSARMMSARDPWINMLRTTTACFAAGVGGADTITVRPHTAALGNPDDFASRIARNVQIVLQEESAIGRVRDPTGGSWFAESLTRRIAEKAWALFQEIESRGGMAAALGSGWFQGLIAGARDQVDSAVATRKHTLVGVSEFANLVETAITMPKWPERSPPKKADMAQATSLKDLRQAVRTGDAPAFAPSGETSADRLEPMRLAAPLEALRDAAVHHGVKTGTAPRVYLVTLGTASDFSARARFAGDLLAAGGVATLSAGRNLTDADAAVEAFGKSGAPVAILCSSDRVYDTLAADTVAALKDAGAGSIYMSGKPANADELEQAGVAGFLYAGCDIVEVLENIHGALGVGR